MSAFVGAGKKAGLEVWRVDNFDVVTVASSDHGILYEGDCYIILHTSNNLRERHVFYWIGSESTQDERATVALKTIELDNDHLKGDAVQHRECQGHESSHFLSLFPSLEYRAGELSKSAFNVIQRDVYEPRLLHLKGRRRVRVKQVPLSTSSLNHGDVFVLDLGLTLIQWNGVESSRIERAKGLDVTCKIKDIERGSKPKVVLLDDGQSDDPSSNPEAADFWNNLQGSKDDVLSSEEGGLDEEHDKNSTEVLYHVSDASGTLECSKLDTPNGLTRELLDTNDCFILDLGNELFVWVGRHSTNEEKTGAMKFAEDFLVQNNRPEWTPITRVIEDGETPLFKDHFKNWGNITSSTVDFSKRVIATPGTCESKFNKITEIDIDDVISSERSRHESQIFKMDTGSKSIKVWRVQNLRQVELPLEDYGTFYSGDSYLIHLSFKIKNRLNQYIYYYQGRDSSRDETTASAFLAVSLGDQIGDATQCRIVQNKEPAHFINIWDNRMIVKLGDWDTPEEEREAVRLYHIRGTTDYDTRAVQVPTSAKNLNAGDAFVVDDTVNNKVYLWIGEGCNDNEMIVAQNVADLYGKNKEIIKINEGSETDDFWNALGGKEEYPREKELQLQGNFQPRLFQCSDALGKYRIEEVLNFCQDDLISDDVMILDVYFTVFVWIGSGSTDQEKERAFESAQKYVSSIKDGRDPSTPIMKIEEGNEPSLFTSHFIGWQEKRGTDFVDPYQARLDKLNQSSKISSGNQPEWATLAARKKQNFVDPLAKKVVEKKRDNEQEVVVPLVNTVVKQVAVPQHCLEHLKNLPENFDRSRLESYLDDEKFVEIFSMSRSAFEALPKWKQIQKKKDLGWF
ncbi:hypothetical protein RCL1_001300 [Eukaryota sp. TZLM3-RCL]